MSSRVIPRFPYNAELSVGELPHRSSKSSLRHAEPLHHRSVGRPRRVDLTHQLVRTIHRLMTMLHKLTAGVAHFACPLPHYIWKHCTPVEMGAHTLSEIDAAARTEVCAVSEQVRNKLMLPNIASTRDALDHRVAETVSE